MIQAGFSAETMAQILKLPDSWVIFDIKQENGEIWFSLKRKEEVLSDNSKVEILRHLDSCGDTAYVKIYYSNEEDLNSLPLYTKIGFAKAFVMDINRMLTKSKATVKSLCSLYNITEEELNRIKKELNRIKEERNTNLLA